jgi:GNAT superfamily N-acetyltransferase
MRSLTEESASQFARAWQAMVCKMPGALIAEKGAIGTAFANVPLFILNALFLNKPVNNRELETALEVACHFAEGCHHPWMLVGCDEWMPAGAGDIFASHGLQPAFGFTGMVTDALADPARPVPPELELRSGLDTASLEALMDVNAMAYGFPVELGRSAMKPGLLEHDSFCVVGRVGGRPVSVTATFAVDGCLYVGWVATVPEARGKGYAETVMRRSLADASAATGITRTVLHASDAGHPIYLRMGYKDTVTFTTYVHGLDASH